MEVTRLALKLWGQTVGYVRDINGLLIEICTPVGQLLLILIREVNRSVIE